jgi:hypothetical protein
MGAGVFFRQHLRRDVRHSLMELMKTR